MCYYLIFHMPNFLIALTSNQLNDQKQPCTTMQESSCSVKLPDGLFDHNPRRIFALDFTLNIFINLLI